MDENAARNKTFWKASLLSQHKDAVVRKEIDLVESKTKDKKLVNNTVRYLRKGSDIESLHKYNKKQNLKFELTSQMSEKKKRKELEKYEKKIDPGKEIRDQLKKATKVVVTKCGDCNLYLSKREIVLKNGHDL